MERLSNLPEQISSRRYSHERQQAIAVVEALRSGIPTRLSTRTLPDIRATLTTQIHEDLQQLGQGQSPLGRLIWGAYGQGKTHALAAIEHLALDSGFAVSRISLSREVSCHHLMNFYARVAPVVRLPDTRSSGILTAILRQSTEAVSESVIAHLNRYVHPLPSLVLEDLLFASGEDLEFLYGDLVGSRLPTSELRRIHRSCRGSSLPRGLTPFRPLDHATAYFGVMADAACFCGYKGWVILIDEVELIGRLGKAGRMKAYLHLNWLLNWSRHHTYPIYTVGVAASSLRNDVWFSGVASPRSRNDHQEIPALAAEKLGSEAERDLKHFFDQGIGPLSPSLKPLDRSDLLILLHKVKELHGVAYDWDPKLDEPTFLKQIGQQPVRTYLRAALEALDLAYVYHETPTLHPAPLVEPGLDPEEDPNGEDPDPG